MDDVKDLVDEINETINVDRWEEEFEAHQAYWIELYNNAGMAYNEDL